MVIQKVAPSPCFVYEKRGPMRADQVNAPLYVQHKIVRADITNTSRYPKKTITHMTKSRLWKPRRRNATVMKD